MTAESSRPSTAFRQMSHCSLSTGNLGQTVIISLLKKKKKMLSPSCFERLVLWSRWCDCVCREEACGGYPAPCPCPGDLCACWGFRLVFWLPPRGSLAHHPSQVCVPIPNSQHGLCQGLFPCQSPQQPRTPGIRNPAPHWVYCQ